MRTHLALALVLFSSTAHADLILSFDSTPQSWVGRGESFTVTPDDGYLFSYRDWSTNGLSFRISSLNSPFGPDFDPLSGERYNYWVLNLTAPFGHQLTSGFYGDARRTPTRDGIQAGLDFYGNHRGNNRLTGFFNVLDIAYDPAGLLQTFAVDFTQFGEGLMSRRIDGHLRYNSSIPIRISEPSAVVLMALGLLGFFWMRRRKLSRAEPA